MSVYPQFGLALPRTTYANMAKWGSGLGSRFNANLAAIAHHDNPRSEA